MTELNHQHYPPIDRPSSSGEDPTTLKQQLKFISKYSLRLAAKVCNCSELIEEVEELRSKVEEKNNVCKQLTEQNIRLAKEKIALIEKISAKDDTITKLEQESQELSFEVAELKLKADKLLKEMGEYAEMPKQLKHLSKKCLRLCKMAFRS